MPTDTTAERILAAAHALFDAHGAEAVTMRRVAADVGLSAMAIYRHFPNREALLTRLSNDSFEDAARTWASHARQQDPHRRLLAMLESYLDYALAHPHLFDHAFGLPRDDARRFPEDFRARRSPTLNLIADAIAEGMVQGAMRKLDEWDLAMDLWAHAHGLIALYRGGRFSFDEKRFRTFYLASLGRTIDAFAP
ncbi:TetR/AcrR family transcriptional regulator [Luteibacter flocculans]|uniref:TetR/AcrR family transcriptional regulator n=1 Tax=Luteibacter flocculans TaxID=2780091 RepID=A0ABY4T5J3_9GAMM|nr:TetR/AcrR family transcriptional regulator [Luteibacter flocculans]URL59470.1 TetR/AcrR family transcriptional regulator [Luteibacter flocculans]